MIRLCAFADESGSSLMEQITQMKKNNIFLLELRSIEGKNISDFSYEEVKQYYQILNDNGIKVWSIGSPLGKIDIKDANEHLIKVEKVCKIAKIFNTKRIRIFSFFNSNDNFELVEKYLYEMNKIASRYDLILCHENEKDIYGDTIEKVLKIYNLGLSNLKLIFDPANFIQCGENINLAIDKLFDKTEYFHIKDVISSTQEIVPAGHGDTNFDKIVQLINKSNKDYVLTLEPHLTIFEGYKDIDKTELKNKYVYKNNHESFKAACDALKEILYRNNYIDYNGCFIQGEDYHE